MHGIRMYSNVIARICWATYGQLGIRVNSYENMHWLKVCSFSFIDYVFTGGILL